jgi:hypothetical protein
MNLPEVGPGDVVFTRNLKAHFFDQQGEPVLQASFSSGRKHKFVMLMLGTVEDGTETTLDLDKILKAYGYIPDPSVSK